MGGQGDGGSGARSLIGAMRLLAAMGGAEIVPADIELPPEILAACPEVQGYQTPWGPVAICGDDRLWFQRPGEGWIEWRGFDLPEDFKPLTTAARPGEPEPPPPSPPPGLNPLKVALGVVAVAALAGLLYWLLRSGDDPEEGNDQLTLAPASTTSSTTSSTTTTTTTTVPDDDSGDTTDDPGGPITGLPPDVAERGADGLGLGPGVPDSWEGLEVMAGAPEWRSGDGRTPAAGPGIESYGALRTPDGDLYVVVLDAPIDGRGIPGAGSQIELGRASTVFAPDGLAGLAGAEEIFSLEAGGAVSGFRPDGTDPGEPRGTWVDGRYGFLLVPVGIDEEAVRLVNFFRQTDGATATETDPTGYQVSEAYHLTDGGLVPAG